MSPSHSAPAPAAAPPGLDVERLRADFPILREEVNGRPIAYLDNAATSQKPRPVLDALERYFVHDNANVHRGMHELSRRATDGYEGARRRVAEWIGARSPAEVIWTRGTTEAINLVASSWGSANLAEGDEILLSEMEHHSNIVPWQLAAERTGARLRYLDVDDEGRLRLDQLPGILEEGRVRIAALTQVSNALGTINPIPEIARQVHDAGALLLVDGAQGAAHHRANVDELGADFYAFSGHKMCGPTGIGVLWAREKLLDAMPPYQGGGEMIDLVEKQASTWAALPAKFEAGTPNIAGAVGMAAAVDYLESVGTAAILRHEQELVAHAIEGLADVEGIRLFGPPAPERSGVVSFTLEGIHPHDVSQVLDSEAVAVRAGHHCAQLLMRRYGIPATTRASFYLYNTRDEVDRLVRGMDTVLRIFRGEGP